MPTRPPFSILGPQPLESGSWVIRVWMPEAHHVTLLLGGQEIAMATPHHPWIFEAEQPTDPGCNYSVRVERGGITHEQHDPWAFRAEWMGKWTAIFLLKATITTSGAGWVPIPASGKAFRV